MISVHIKLTYFITCDYCKRRTSNVGYGHTTERQISAEVEVPDGWVQLGKDIMCPECINEDHYG
jgi:hypothetical protein